METRRTNLTRDLFEPADVGSRESERISAPPSGFFRDAWRQLKKNRGSVIGLAVISFLILMAIIGPWLTQYTYFGQNLSSQYQGPSASHWFGTDSFGRDQWARVWYGARVSLYIAFLAAGLDLVIGVAYGAVSGLVGGLLDSVMQRIIEVLVGIPNLIVIVLLMLILKPGIITITFALIITGWVPMARLVRAQVLKLREEEFFLASQSLGARRLRLIARHLIPNTLGIIIIQLMITIPLAIFFEAFLSFIGLGIQPPEASLGALVNSSYQEFRFHPYLLWFPVAVIGLLMICFNLLADGLRDALDPRMRE